MNALTKAESTLECQTDTTRDGRTTTPKKTATGWLKRMGWAAFLFFLVKGLIWLALAVFASSYLW